MLHPSIQPASSSCPRSPDTNCNPRLAGGRNAIALALFCIIACSNHHRFATADDSLKRQLTDSISVELSLTPQPHFVITGIAPELLPQAQQELTLSVHKSDSTDQEQTPNMLGRCLVQDEHLEFHPRFPLSRSIAYRVNLPHKLLREDIDHELLIFRLPDASARPMPRVEAIYPSDATLPENLLKFYIYFSQPMSRGGAYERVELWQGDTRIEEPFLELGEELWNAEQTRFTLFIHPGRIKRGVQPRELKGPPLNFGKEYALRIDGDWPDAHGVSLGSPVEKRFTVTAPIHEQLDPLQWHIDTPPVRTRQPVKLTFDRPLDQAMLGRVLEVKYNDGTLIEGSIEIKADETEWWFTPAEAWKIGAYHIEVATHLEDLCGNSLAAPFEVKLERGITETPAAKVAISFIVK